MDETETPAPLPNARPRNYELNTESIFILPALEIRFQTRQLFGKFPFIIILIIYTFSSFYILRTSTL